MDAAGKEDQGSQSQARQSGNDLCLTLTTRKQASEANAWERKHQEAQRTVEALQRSMVAASEKDAALTLSHEAQANRIAALEARCAVLEREHEAATAASARDRAAAEEAKALQELLCVRVRALAREMVAFVNPYTHESKVDVDGNGDDSTVVGRYQAALEAAEAELAAAAR